MTKRRWNPDTGESHTFADDETPPANFLPCHPNDPDRDAKVGKPAVAQKSDDAPVDMSGDMTKAQIAEALKAGGVEFNPADNKAVLCEQLITALKAALTARNIEFREDETASALLAKVNPKLKTEE